MTADAIGDPDHLTRTVRVNGEVGGSGHSGAKHHRFQDSMAFISQAETVHASEMIGAGGSLEFGQYLNSGDGVELAIETIGVLRHRFRKAVP